MLKRIGLYTIALFGLGWLGASVWFVLSLKSSVNSIARPPIEAPSVAASAGGNVGSSSGTQAIAAYAGGEDLPLDDRDLPELRAAADVADGAPIYRTTWYGYRFAEIQRGESSSLIQSEVPFDSYIALFESSGFKGDVVSEAQRHANNPFIRELTCLRGFRYYFMLPAKGADRFEVFFANDQNTSLEALLGDRYSTEAQLQFDEVGFEPGVFWDMGDIRCVRIGALE